MKPQTMIDLAAGMARYAVNRPIRLRRAGTNGLGAVDTEPLVDRFTIGHVAIGTLLGLAAVPWWLTFGQAVAWEIIENPLKRRFPRIFPSARPDSLPAATADVVACMAGWLAMRMLPPGPEPLIWRGSPYR